MDPFSPQQLAFISMCIAKKEKMLLKIVTMCSEWSISEWNKWGLKSISDEKLLDQLSLRAKIKCLGQRAEEICDKGCLRVPGFKRMHGEFWPVVVVKIDFVFIVITIATVIKNRILWFSSSQNTSNVINLFNPHNNSMWQILLYFCLHVRD